MKHKVIFKNKKFSPFSNVRKAPIYQAAKQICHILQKNKFEAYIVGGAIRDLIINPNKVPKDIDIATSANPDDVYHFFKNTHFVGQAFGVCLIKLRGQQFELTTFRKEGKYLDRRRPESISKGTFVEDSNRRDFTINSLYYDPIKKIIIDPHAGLDDIKNKIIRCVGNSNDRLYEDALRILRMVRFAANLNFTITNDSLKAAKKQAIGIHMLSKERILLEFQKIKLGRFHYFCNSLEQISDLKSILFENLTFPIEENKYLLKNTHALSKIKLDTTLPFFNFMKSFLFLYDLDKEKSNQLSQVFDSWPLTVDDKKVCLLFLKCIFYKESMPKNIDIELLDFIFYENLTFINSTAKKNSRCILINLSIFIKDNLLKETLYKMIDNISKENKHVINSDEVVKMTEKNNLDKKYISVIIKYMQYIYLKRELVPKLENVIQFRTQFFKDYFEIGSKHAYSLK